MEEKRKSRRLDLDVSIELERLDQGEMTTVKMIHVNVTDLSRSGIGFFSSVPMEVGSHYDTRLKIWTNETIQSVIRIVRCDKAPDGYSCGATFVGMTSTDELKIDIYSMLNPEE